MAGAASDGVSGSRRAAPDALVAAGPKTGASGPGECARRTVDLYRGGTAAGAGRRMTEGRGQRSEGGSPTSDLCAVWPLADHQLAGPAPRVSGGRGSRGSTFSPG